MTYVPEKGYDSPWNAFGATTSPSSKRFDDEVDEGVLFEEAEIYYANIVLPYGPQVMKAFDRLKELDLKMLATAHGIIWRKNISKILEKYVGYATYRTPAERCRRLRLPVGSRPKSWAKAIAKRISSEGVP